MQPDLVSGVIGLVLSTRAMSGSMLRDVPPLSPPADRNGPAVSAHVC